ncbi:MAG TPA: diadenylate cyclase CdaA [Verrucomicrobiae bacterium]|nr:diadenylate cyclase CdaA [Verrucomicrobiae bacterium]
MEFILEIVAMYWKPVFEIALLAAFFYYMLLLFRGTRGAAVLTGFVIVFLGIVGVTQVFELDVINWILSRVLAFLAIAVLVIFQPELRRALAEVGSRQFFTSPKQRGEMIDVLVETARSLSQKRCGGLMAVEREIGFRGVAETGVPIGAKATPELLTTIFFPNTPLHDGGVVLRGDQIVSAACVFPLTQRQGLSASIGMRHRAAMGLTEDTDAVVVAVSEETGEISVAHRGHLVKGLDPDGLRAFLATTLTSVTARGNWLVDLARRVLGSMVLREAPSEGEPELGATGETFDEPAVREPSEKQPEEPERRGEARH